MATTEVAGGGDDWTQADSEGVSGTRTVWDVSQGEGELSHWLEAARAAGLEEILAGPGPITVFAPTNDAFEAWQAAQGDGKFDASLAGHAVLKPLVDNHLMDGRVSGEQLFRRNRLLTWGGEVNVEILSDRATVGGAMVSAINLEASNGVIHIVESVVVAP